MALKVYSGDKLKVRETMKIFHETLKVCSPYFF